MPPSTPIFVVHKFPFGDELLIDLPAGRILKVAPQHADDVTPTVWLLRTLGVDNKPDPTITQAVQIVGTGYEFTLDHGEEFVDSVVCASGKLVFHCFRRELPTPVCSDDHSSGEPCPVHGYDDSVPAPVGTRYERVTLASGEVRVNLVSA